MDSKELGFLGEKMACEYLVEKGYKIIEKNYRVQFGEIDIIAKKKFNFFKKNEKTIHFVEVKTIIDNHSSFFPEEKVNYDKQKKLKQMAEIWMTQNNLPENFPYQIDIIGILVDKEYKNKNFFYFPNAVDGSI